MRPEEQQLAAEPEADSSDVLQMSSGHGGVVSDRSPRHAMYTVRGTEHAAARGRTRSDPVSRINEGNGQGQEQNERVLHGLEAASGQSRSSFNRSSSTSTGEHRNEAIRDLTSAESGSSSAEAGS